MQSRITIEDISTFVKSNPDISKDLVEMILNHSKKPVEPQIFQTQRSKYIHQNETLLRLCDEGSSDEIIEYLNKSKLIDFSYKNKSALKKCFFNEIKSVLIYFIEKYDYKDILTSIISEYSKEGSYDKLEQICSVINKIETSDKIKVSVDLTEILCYDSNIKALSIIIQKCNISINKIFRCIHHCTFDGNMSLAEMLVNHVKQSSFDKKSITRHARYLLIYACELDNYEMFEYIIDNFDTKINTKNPGKFKCIDYNKSVYNCGKRLFRLCIDNDDERFMKKMYEKIDKHGFTSSIIYDNILYSACERNYLRLVKILDSNDIFTFDIIKKCFDKARNNNHDDVVTYFLDKHGYKLIADLDKSDSNIRYLLSKYHERKASEYK